MEITLLTVGKTKTPFITAGIKEYVDRLGHYIDFTLNEIPDIKTTKSLSEKNQKEKEGQMILSKLNPSDFVILLDEHGMEFNSEEFASYLQKIMSTGRKRLIFVVGGPYGFSDEVYSRADAKISLSKMTFNHEMVRVFFIEQLYRAMTILRGEPYHHK